MEKPQNFREFYPYYLTEHENVICRRFHFLGSSSGLICLFLAFWFHNLLFLGLAFVVGYGCAWIGHFFFEKNKPATFRYPFYSFVADWVMFADILTGRVKV